MSLSPRLLALLLAASALAGCDRGPPAPPDVPAAESAALLERNKAEPGVVTTATGLQYKVVRSGPEGGYQPKRGDAVKVHYEGRLPSGEVFDSSYEDGTPRVFTVGGLVEGWNEALQLMKPGDEWLLTVPPELGYGDDGAGPIPGGAVLIFKMELLDVLPRESGTANG
jgi:peptidylprolyl isomerase/FKBP-type peptidyl-prolyl cis-trans isomerase FklB